MSPNAARCDACRLSSRWGDSIWATELTRARGRRRWPRVPPLTRSAGSCPEARVVLSTHNLGGRRGGRATRCWKPRRSGAEVQQRRGALVGGAPRGSGAPRGAQERQELRSLDSGSVTLKPPYGRRSASVASRWRAVSTSESLRNSKLKFEIRSSHSQFEQVPETSMHEANAERKGLLAHPAGQSCDAAAGEFGQRLCPTGGNEQQIDRSPVHVAGPLAV